ncbi:MAG: glycosyltransferase, partial [Kiritimatiellia bacterium]
MKTDMLESVGATSSSAGRGARCDLHIHSKYSDRPSEWFLRRIGAPESFAEPRELYRLCREQGMDYVTISDHNCIRGALEISDLPGTFLSSELTTYFPEDRCKVHVLVSGISTQQFEQLQAARENVYDLRAYLVRERIVHAVAHPLFRVNDRLTVAHFEKLLVLFNVFEGINGSRDSKGCAVARAILQNLDRSTVDLLADKHNLEPAGERYWEKRYTGGSDDHSGLYAAQAYTETPSAKTVFDYLEHLRAGRHVPGGRDGCSLQLANSLFHIAHHYLQVRLGGGEGGNNLISLLLKNAAGPSSSSAGVSVGRGGLLRRMVEPVVRRHKLKQLSEPERLLVEDFLAIADMEEDEAPPAIGHDARFAMAARLAHPLTLLLLRRFVDKTKGGDLMGALQALASMGPVVLGVMPFMTAFSTQHKDNTFMRALCLQYPAGEAVLRGKGGKAWITDTFYEVNGVARTIHKLAALSHAADKPVTVLTSIENPGECPFPAYNFKPVGTFSLPEYPELTMALPPLLDVVRHIEEQDYDSLIISTPGPMGLVGLLAARVLNLPVRGIYHTDFPHYVETWTDDASMGEMAKQFMRWFYRNMEIIYAPTRAYEDVLVDLGFRRDQLAVLPRGVDPEEFNPRFRDATFWERFGLPAVDFVYVYVGRVSSEKNIDVLLEAHRSLTRDGLAVGLAVVGDGPDMQRLKERYGDDPTIVFTGYLHGDDLSCAFASADALAFPSMSDTFGNVVLEAAASGLPAVVSDKGGPQELVRANDGGIVCDARQAATYA